MSLPDDPKLAVQELARRYPCWTIWGSGIGRYWATRQETQPRPGCCVTVDADDLPALDDQLFEQERLRARSAS